MFKNFKYVSRGVRKRNPLLEREFIKTINEMISMSLNSPNAVRSNERTKHFAEWVRRTSKFDSDFEVSIQTIYGTTRVDCILTKPNGEKILLSFMFPMQSIKKNINNSTQHLDGDTHGIVDKKITKVIKIVFLPSQSLNKNTSKNSFTHEDITGFCERKGVSIPKSELITKVTEFGKHKAVYNRYTIIYNTNNNFLDAVQNVNAEENRKYVNGIETINEFYAFFKDMNS